MLVSITEYRTDTLDVTVTFLPSEYNMVAFALADFGSYKETRQAAAATAPGASTETRLATAADFAAEVAEIFAHRRVVRLETSEIVDDETFRFVFEYGKRKRNR
jgi:hypothetical protein